MCIGFKKQMLLSNNYDCKSVMPPEVAAFCGHISMSLPARAPCMIWVVSVWTCIGQLRRDFNYLLGKTISDCFLSRYERSGTMHGLFRVRGFTQDDAHIFCLPDQIATEITGVLDLVEEILTTFGFPKYEVNLSTRPEKSVGSDEIWQTSEAALVEALGMKGWAYGLDEVSRPAFGCARTLS